MKLYVVTWGILDNIFWEASCVWVDFADKKITFRLVGVCHILERIKNAGSC